MKTLKLFSLAGIFCILIMSTFTGCEMSSLSTKKRSDSSNEDTRLDETYCLEHSATNYEHVAAGRAEVYTKWYFWKYAKAIGSGDDLGYLGSQWYSPTTIITEHPKGYFTIGTHCPREKKMSVSGKIIFENIDPLELTISLQDEKDCINMDCYPINTYSTTSDLSGNYSFPDVDSSIYYLSIAKPNDDIIFIHDGIGVTVINRDVIVENIIAVDYNKACVNPEQTCKPMQQVYCPAVILPVCGCDGNTFNNSCEACKQGVHTLYSGKCR